MVACVCVCKTGRAKSVPAPGWNVLMAFCYQWTLRVRNATVTLGGAHKRPPEARIACIPKPLSRSLLNSV